jgi:hypothetical protein
LIKMTFHPTKDFWIICEKCGKESNDYDHIKHWCHECCIKNHNI